MKENYFDNVLLPYVEKNCEVDPEAARFMRGKWKKFERIAGIQLLLKRGDHRSICQIFDLAT